MSRKSATRKSTSLWEKCEVCQAVISQKDHATHLNGSCPQAPEAWNHAYIMDGVLYSTLEQLPSVESLKNLPSQEREKLVLLSQSALQICGMVIGDPVIISSKGNSAVKIAWPTSEKSVTSVLMIKEGLEMFRGQFGDQICVRKLNVKPLPAQEVRLKPLTHIETSSDLSLLIHHQYNSSIISVRNRLRILHYGRPLTFEVTDIKPYKMCDVNIEEAADDISRLKIEESETFSESCQVKKSVEVMNDIEVYSVISSTSWVLQRTSALPADDKQDITVDDVGGMVDIVNEITELMNLAFGDVKPFAGLRPTRGVLLHGPPGAGKSFIARAIANSSGASVTYLHSSELTSDAKAKLSALSSAQGQHVAIIDDVDVTCRKRGPGSVSLCLLLDSLHSAASRVIVLATTRHPDDLDPTLRRPGRLEREIEVGVPNPAARLDILGRLLPDVTHDVLSDAAAAAHGFVPADLASLASHAVLSAARHGASQPVKDDFAAAFLQVRPSALREVLVQVPNVQWSDIGGQHDLKLKLRQAVEWPLRHPQAFSRLGISPPRGVLMFGPPGCSKTMIAKALATESKLNFISIKGPELFSKWVGESERAVREVFRRARLVAPAIVFFDELDALGGVRGDGGGSNNVQERVLAQLLTEMDGVTPLGNVTVVGATNRPDRIDKALLRPGRLDRIIYVPLPDADTRREIFMLQLGRRTPVASDVNVEELVQSTEGYSGAEVLAVCHEAALKALEDDLETDVVAHKHFQAALQIVTPRTPPSLLKLYETYLQS
ncbi:ATPase family protein 2 homolog isoform X1 [Schistocerca piceifrons]|uniref:ATPase family protein 2 homolog isoform X1 n=2 Tax=Schistocerca piceifrons TaxID=274613 RepID=UPI001F5E4EC1|nr:ATPase family protein 2 homolog isoform X1 [Schistocerca piceifrons]XP_047119835.1 ATPase family protein 2 homolog isoform X1 [Schistocerca piceifrons]XP_047119836.1 ATPase family protein 2 homolog isoform X1 [Schistocerca piceifrons]XP_047119837.1 ATPase family protein 2 homolog isoform X1 [Schistocerca piceifrons]XP_047119838.1 ATPase family protein 2 homolog isoform X1 [Schistocerca piceifrons]XP_047119839.1 ATPase family protein 2 homolog isoform X1 [Schistocerca piceifrons]XP_04711984